MQLVETKKLNNGVDMPYLGLGTWQLQGDKCTETVKMALEIGYTHIDTAHAYENHMAIRYALQGKERRNLFLTSKIWRDYHDPKKVSFLCDLFLKELGTSYLDQLLLHWPENGEIFLEMIYQMKRLEEQGKVRSVGVSNATIHHIEDLAEQGLEIAINQVECHPFLDQRELVDFCLKKRIAVTAYSPIARGKVFASDPIKEIAESKKQSPAAISLRWLVQRGIIVIPKAATKEHLQDNLKIFTFTLSPDEMQKIDGLNRNERLIEPEFNEFDY